MLKKVNRSESLITVFDIFGPVVTGLPKADNGMIHIILVHVSYHTMYVARKRKYVVSGDHVVSYSTTRNPYMSIIRGTMYYNCYCAVAICE